MRRNALCLTASLCIATLLGGCSLFQKKPAATGLATTGSADLYAPMQEPVYTQDPYPSYAAAAPVEESYQPTTSMPTSTTTMEPRYHTVVRHDTLYSLARSYYGDHHRWKDIYQANQPELSDPNRIRVGQRLVIP